MHHTHINRNLFVEIRLNLLPGYLDEFMWRERASGPGQVRSDSLGDIQAVSGVKGLYTFKTAPLGATTSEKSHDHQTQFLSHTLLFQNYFNFHFIRNVVVVSNK